MDRHGALGLRRSCALWALRYNAGGLKP